MKKFSRLGSALLLALPFSSFTYIPSDTLWHGTIKFPAIIKHLPIIRVYYAGVTVATTPETWNRLVSFDIPESKVRNTFCLVIVDHVDFIAEQNTVQYLQAPLECSYKMYTMHFTPNKDSIEHTGTWQVIPQQLGPDRRLPDNAIIVCLDADLVKSVEGGDRLNLPKIILDEQILAQYSDQELQDIFAQFLLTAIDSDSIHAKQSILTEPNFAKKTVISMICS
jgi:hypothetical protein